MTRHQLSRLRRTLGFNLIETLVAMALLAVVILSISALFIHGGKGVKSGGNLSRVNALARKMMEDMDQQPPDTLWESFAIDETGATGEVASVKGLVPGGMVSIEMQEAVTKWQEELTKLPKAGGTAADATIDFAGVYDRDDDATENEIALKAVSVIRVQVRVSWTEGIRARTATFHNIRTFGEL